MAPPSQNIERDNQVSEDIIGYLLAKNDEDRLLEVAKSNTDNVELVTRICERIHEILNEINTKKTQLEESIKQESTRESEIKTTIPYYKYSAEERSNLDNIAYHRTLYAGLPERLRINFVQYQRKLTDASILLLQAAYTSYQKELKIVKFNNAPPSNASAVVADIAASAAKPSDSMEVDNNNKNGSPTTSEGDAQEEALYKKFQDVLEKVLAPIQLPDCIMEIAKILDDNKMGILCIKVCQRAADAILAQRALVTKNQVQSHLELNQLPYAVAERATGSLFSTLAFFKDKIAKKEALSQQELQELELLQNGELLKEIIEFYIPTVLNDPELILKIGQFLLSKEQFKHVILLTERARMRLDATEVSRKEKLQLEKKIRDLQVDIKSIERVNGSTTAKTDEVKALQKQLDVFKLLPSHYQASDAQIGDFTLRIAQLRVKCILEMKKASKVNVNNSIGDVNEKLYETLDTLRDPKHIYELAKLIQSHKENEAALRYGERCQMYIGELENQREIRLPIQSQYDEISKQEETLRLAGTKLSAIQQEKLDAFRAKLDPLPAWPYFANLFDRYQYDELHLLIAIVMISSVLDSKNSLESQVGIAEYAAKKELIDRQFENLVHLCLEKFKDPAYLVKFSTHMRGSKEDKVVIKITNQLFKRCAEIEDMRLERLSALKRIRTTTESIPRATPEKQQQLFAKKKEQEQALEELPVWPHYARLDVERQYEDTKYQASLALMESLLECHNFIEEKLRKKKMFNQAIAANVSEEDLIKERDLLNHRITESLAVCLPNLDNPKLIVNLATQLGPRRESIFVDIAKYFHPKLEELAAKASQLKQDQVMLALLEEELVDLTRMKKDMSDEDLGELEGLRDHVTKTAGSVPYLEEYLTTHTYHSTMCTLGITYVYQARLQNYSKFGDTPALLEPAIRQSKENIAFVHKLIDTYVENPNTLITIMETLLAKKELASLGAVGKLAFSKLDKFRAFQSDVKSTAEKKKVLSDDKEALDKQRRRLPTEKHRQLRQLIAKQKIDEARPDFQHADADKFALQVANILISSVSNQKSAFEASITSMDEESLHTVPAQRRKLIAEIEAMAKMCVSYISSLETLMKFAQDLFDKKEYALVIQVGRVVEEIIDEKRLLIERKEELTKEYRVHQQQYLQQKDDTLRAKIQIQIDRTLAASEALRPPYTYDEICQHTLTITQLIINAANFEDLGEVIRDQTIVAFKVDPTAARWDGIRNLSSEEEWAEIKEQLVVFVMKREENLNSKIELLMKDGLFKQCIEIFPHPSTEEDELNTQMMLLESLYEAVDQHSIQHLPAVLPLIHKYAKRCYQEWKSERLESLFDVLQRRYPEEIAKMFEAAVDMILVNILQSQYPALLTMLKTFKKRMVVTLGLEPLWLKFLESFKQKNKSKKRLIQMINLIGDSVWQIEQPNNPHPVQKKKKGSIQLCSRCPN
ncbi:hypothetical protein DFA_08925 [Cavenderia fasciculata]|uniref:Uncharacterized protein n=1 Tax=Cavenderia fasciculata TaxID=261658 RepID=F4Q531_CACFS|nr:uncharacterized protein DFA_08925 [Cavenderia fasciculata]EGG17924.1 hypothetical protein DFA_08925 [Cavenderia fasciculata]|eukprot:XP_004356408.1 hypothetical protein DFA_08925 [Cavenderia fasciculata]